MLTGAVRLPTRFCPKPPSQAVYVAPGSLSVPSRGHLPLLDAHALFAQPCVLWHEGPRVEVAAKHLEGFFVCGGRGHFFLTPGLRVVPGASCSFL
jgi:hypothetical protein